MYTIHFVEEVLAKEALVAVMMIRLHKSETEVRQFCEQTESVF